MEDSLSNSLTDIIKDGLLSVIKARIELLKNRLIVNQIERGISYQNIIDYLNELEGNLKNYNDSFIFFDKIDKISNVINKILTGDGKKKKIQ